MLGSRISCKGVRVAVVEVVVVQVVVVEVVDVEAVAALDMRWN